MSEGDIQGAVDGSGQENRRVCGANGRGLAHRAELGAWWPDTAAIPGPSDGNAGRGAANRRQGERDDVQRLGDAGYERSRVRWDAFQAVCVAGAVLALVLAAIQLIALIFG